MSRLNGLTITLIVPVVMLTIALVMLFQGEPSQKLAAEITYPEFLHEQKSIRDVTIRGNELTGHLAIDPS